MRLLAAGLLAVTGCIAVAQTPIPLGYDDCAEGRVYSTRCEDYFYWVPPSYTVYGYWHPGHWSPRPGYLVPIRDHRR